MLTPDTFDTVLDLKNDDIRVSKYLRGETIDYDDTELKVTGKQKNTNRYVLICVDGFSLGFGKLSNGSIKNKYLPGWRMMS